MRNITATPWPLGEPYVVAPAMTAIVTAAAQALDLTGEALPDDIAPDNGGVTVFDDHLEGYAWGENTGWIRLGTCTGGSSSPCR